MSEEQLLFLLNFNKLSFKLEEINKIIKLDFIKVDSICKDVNDILTIHIISDSGKIKCGLKMED